MSTSLPPAQVGQAYSAKLTAKGGTAPLSWALTAGTLPAGLALEASDGVISGTPTAGTTGTALTFTVTDSYSSAHRKSVSLTLTVNPANITVSITPANAALTVSQTLTLVATTNDYAGVTWSSSPAGGSFSNPKSASGSAVTFTAPATAGAYTVTATSITDSASNVGITIGVTDLGGVYTYHNDAARDGVNAREFALTPANVNTHTFGKLFSCAVDGAVYAQPLWVANLSVGGSSRNVIFAATAHDSLYAFDADSSPCVQLWHVSLIDTSHGATAGEVTVPDGTSGNYVGHGDGDITPEVGVIGTPVIDPSSGTLYVVSLSMTPGMPPETTSYYQRLHAIDITSGSEKSGSPAPIKASYPGTAAGGTTVSFSPRQENQRAGLALVNGVVYVGWGSHEDSKPWYGWLMGYAYDGSAFSQKSVLNTAPDGGGAGVWGSGGAPAVDLNDNLYVLTGNGPFDITSTSPPNSDYGDCALQLNGQLRVTSWFAPSQEAEYYKNNMDLGAGGPALVLNLSSGPLAHLVIGGGKTGTMYLLNGDSMGGFGDTNAWQKITVGARVYATGTFWNNRLYIAPDNRPMRAYAFDPSTNMFNTTPVSQSPTEYGFPGATAVVSASGGSTDGIVWAIDPTKYCTAQSPGCGPAVLRAYDAANLANELWNSSLVPADAAGNAVKFTVPTVANGKVYVGTRGNNTGGAYQSTSVSGELDVYGLKN